MHLELIVQSQGVASAYIKDNASILAQRPTRAAGPSNSYGRYCRLWSDRVGYLYRLIQGLSFGTFGETLYTHSESLPAWQILAVSTIGGLFIGLFIHFFMPGGRPRGVADFMEGITLHSGRMDIKSTIGAAVVSAASVGVGESGGRKGPVVHIGAGLASWISRQLGVSRTITINLLGCGAAAAISASFNAPTLVTFQRLWCPATQLSPTLSFQHLHCLAW